MRLNKEQILEYQQNRPPYLMIDMVENLKPGVSCDGYKDLNQDEWFFKVHWKNDPNMPGMLQIEALVQMAALNILSLPGNKGKVMYLVEANKLKFLKKILPGERLYIQTKVLEYKRGIASFSAKGFIDKKLACAADFKLVLPDEINKYKLKS
jgi:3-hydroxyacyl-[acyl-carrier-protein] dehydratase